MPMQSRKVLSGSWFQTFALNTYEIIVISFPVTVFGDEIISRMSLQIGQNLGPHILLQSFSIRDLTMARPVYCVGSC